MSSTNTSTAQQRDEGERRLENGDTRDETVAKASTKRLSRYISPKVWPVVAPPLPQQLPPPPPVVRVVPPPPSSSRDNDREPDKRSPRSTVELRVHYMDHTEFQQQATQSAIEVLMEEPRITLRRSQKTGSPSKHDSSDQANARGQATMRPNPTKIRVRSLHILIMLEEIAKMSGRSFTTKYGNSYEQAVSDISRTPQHTVILALTIHAGVSLSIQTFCQYRA